MITTEAVSSWLRQIRPEPDPVLAEMEAHGARDGIPIVDPQGGQLLQVLALARGARRIVEVGTAIGVSTLYMARALPSNGELISFDIDPERQGDASEYLDRAGVGDRVDLRLQDAREGLRELDGPFDMAFIDGVKAQYPDYYELLIDLLGPGAVLAVDNVLMSGTVAEGRSDGHWTDEQIASTRAFNARLLSHEQLTASVLPV
ncbi:MAG TPA: O-methyltransferase, partial [Solirubrobacteraceae bacterium]|nr:O-methyltransferase [Solirubrobacteraceae bacterium]